MVTANFGLKFLYSFLRLRCYSFIPGEGITPTL